jgi:TatD DNase family protein
MAPVPMRGKRNESAYVLYVLKKLAESLGVTEEEVARQTNENVKRVFAVDI